MKVAKPELLRDLKHSHTVIEASAGTGKTWMLEHLFIDLIVHGASIEEILVVTFTEKATREMRARVRARLDAMVHPRGTTPEPTGACWEIDDVARQRLVDALLAFDRAPISTIHGFCQRVLAEHAFLSGRPFRQTLVEPRRAFGRAFRQELRVVLEKDSALRRVLLRVLQDFDADRLEEALFPWFVEYGEPNPRFDADALREALEDWKQPVDEAPVHDAIPRRDVAERVVRELRALRAIAEAEAGREDLLGALLALDRWSQTEVVRNAPARAWLPARLGALPKLRERVDALLDVATSPFGVLVHQLLPRVRTRLEEHKARDGLIDFDDMLRLVDEALRGRGGDALMRALRSQHRFALVDEFQDTDALQWSIFRRLFVEETTEHALFVIGDAKQAIYGFRNADIHTYRRARTELLERGAARVVLDHNHRSTSRVIDAYNAVFEEGFFEGDIRYDEPVRCGDPTKRLIDADGKDASALLLWQPLGVEKPSVEDVRRTLAHRTAVEIRRMVGRLKLVERGEGRPIGYGDIQILTRNAREARGIAEALAAHGIPYGFYKQDGLFDTQEALDVLAVLRAVADPRDRSARLRAWLTPFFAVPLEDLEACADLDPQHPLMHRLHRLRMLAESGDAAALLRALLEESGLARRLLFMKSTERELTNYQHVIEVLLEEVGSRQGAEGLASRLEAFVSGRAEPIGGEGSVQRLESERAAVQLLTMHKSKGLEAPVVFVMGGFTRGGKGEWHRPRIGHVDGARQAWLPPLPTAMERRIEREAREEDERLLYVALTRAKGRIVLPYFGMPPVGAVTVDGAWQRYGPLSGPYRWLTNRLEVLVASGYVDGERVTYEGMALVDEDPLERREVDGIDWSKVPFGGDVEPPQFEALRRERAGYVLTSYTRMKSQRGGYVAPVSEDATAAEEFTAEAHDADPDPVEELPGGASMGVFLHAVLEDLHMPTVRRSSDLERWTRRQDVQSVFERRARQSGIDPRFLPAAQRLVYDALRCPQSFGDIDLPDGFAMLEGVAEMGFLYPVPESAHPALDEALRRGGREFTAERGVIRGIVDLVFAREGRTYFLDWKSDRLPEWDDPAAKLAAHVELNYALQAKLYTLGIVRLLGVHDEAAYEERFGGLLYCFLRTMRAPGQGVVFQRPAWADVLSWEAELRDSAEPWGYPIRPEAP